LIDNEYLWGMQLPLPFPGRHIAFPGSMAVAKFSRWSPLTAGLKLIFLMGDRSGSKVKMVVLDESYNAAPEAMTAALNLLVQTPGKRHIAVLGAMKELGHRSLEFHQKLGNTARQLNLDALILVDGADAEAIVSGADGIPVECFSTHADLGKRLKFVEGDRLLFKTLTFSRT